MLEQKEITEKKKITMPGATFLALFLVIVVGFGVFSTLKVVGKNEMKRAVASDITDDNVSVAGLIEYKGHKYKYNEDLTTVLVMGIDTEGDISEVNVAEDDQLTGGQADALFLLVLNPHDKNVYFLAINRNAMADVDVFDKNGVYTGRRTQQISLQHGYGDGKELSCERQVTAVSRLLYDIPIHSYVALNMEGIPALNDELGGIDVVVLDDIVYPEYNMDLHAGDEVTLMGEQAYWYVRLRHEDEFDSNSLRMERQKQYMTTFAAEAKNQASQDIRVANNLWSAASDYMVTDIDTSTFTYLASEALSYDFNKDNMFTLKGETIEGSGGYEEFYLDQDYMMDTVVRIFYEPVE